MRRTYRTENEAEQPRPGRHFRERRPSVVAALALLTALTLGGCKAVTSKLAGPGGGELTVRSQAARGAALRGGFTTGLYRFDDQNHLTILLVDGPLENPAQVVTMRMLWQPRAGRTPIERTATNASIHYSIFTGPDRREVGVYSGAGFLYPHQDPGQATLQVGLWQSTLRLADRTDRFEDLLGKAVMQGRFRVRRDDLAVEAATRRVHVMIQERLGYPRLVRAD